MEKASGGDAIVNPSNRFLNSGLFFIINTSGNKIGHIVF
jgi:hypothetical protein